MLRGKIAQQRKFEHFSLESLDHQNQPDHDGTEPDHRGDQHDEERPEHWNDEEKKSRQFERDREQDCRAPEQQTLDGMEAYKAIRAYTAQDQEDDRRG